MANLQFKREQSSRGGMSELSVRFYAGRATDQQTRTGIYVPTELWDVAKQRCIISKRYETPANTAARAAQRRIDELADYIYQSFMTAAKADLTPSWLRRTVATFHNPTTDVAVMSLIEPYCDARNVSQAGRRKLNALGNLISAFKTDTGIELSATRLTTEQIEQFQRYLLSGGAHCTPHALNSVVSRLKQLRAIVYFHGRPVPNPFDNFTIPTEVYGTPFYLTVDERDYLYMYDDFTDAQRRQRDIFIFQCLTGCRIGDLYSLRPANVAGGWLTYIPQKTSHVSARSVEVPLSQTAIEIVERYRGADIHGRLFPFISQVKYDEAIHDILRRAAIDRPVATLDPRTRTTIMRPLWQVATSHTARKTFIQALCERGVDRRTISSMTGHSETSRAFNRYSEITRDMKQAALGLSPTSARQAPYMI